VWSASRVKPHRVETSSYPTIPRFDEKLVDVVGLVFDPPKAIVLCADENPRCKHWTAPQASLPNDPCRAHHMVGVPGGSQPPAPTDPYVTSLYHTALVIRP